jgi:hypothetical protein
VMSLLKEELESRSFSPVWFNAWHHQQEEQMLAALLESIRQQAVPSGWSPRGWTFRLKLLALRLHRRWVPVVLVAGLLAAAGAAVSHFAGNIREPAELLETLKSGTQAARFSVVAAIVTALFALSRILGGLKAFGMDPGKLLASIAEKAKLSDLSAQTSFRHRFSSEFRDVTTALQPHTMTIFVDDLDRCEPDQVMQVMQSLNFLASSGSCFLIVAMEEKAVKHCIQTSLKERNFLETDPDRWIEKFVQIWVPVPEPGKDTFLALLTGNGAVAVPTSRFSAIAHWLPPLATIAAALIAFWGINRLLETKPPTAAEPPVATWSAQSIVQPGNVESMTLELAESVPGATLATTADFRSWFREQNWKVNVHYLPSLDEKGEESKSAAPAAGDSTATAPTASSAATRANTPRLIEPGEDDRGLWWLPFLLILPFFWLGRNLWDRWVDRVEDSDEFRQALSRWATQIARQHHTPRAVKRLLNKLRFYAMMMRALQGSDAVAAVPESAIVAFGVLEGDSHAAALRSLPNLAPDVAAFEAAYKRSPGIFDYLRTSAKFERGSASS